MEPESQIEFVLPRAADTAEEVDASGASDGDRTDTEEFDSYRDVTPQKVKQQAEKIEQQEDERHQRRLGLRMGRLRFEQAL